MKKLYHTITHIGLALSFGIILLMFYWSVLDGVYVNRVFNVDNFTYQTNKTQYAKGDPVFVTIDGICKYREIPAHFFANLTDTIYFPYEMQTRTGAGTGCRKNGTLFFLVNIPKTVPASEYKLTGYFEYDINPIRRGQNGIKVTFTTNEFDIIE